VELQRIKANMRRKTIHLKPKRKRRTIQQELRSTMREYALAYRQWISPKRFDGTLATYHHNIGLAMKCLVAAKEMRDASVET